jgi:hypothetical protein
MKILLGVVLGVMVLISGCASSSYVISGTPRSPTDPALVRIYTSPPPASEEIAIITVEGSGWTTQGEKDRAVAELKQKAASLGANGVVLIEMGTESSGFVGNMNPQTGAMWAGQSSYTTMRASAVFVHAQ